MSNWSNEVQPFGANHAPLLTGLSSAGDGTSVPVAVDPATGGLLSVVAGTGGTNSHCYTNQVTVNTTQVQISAVSHTLSNGIIIKAPSTNSDNIYVGLTGVTTTTGDMLEPGEVRGYAVSNLNLLYIISASSTTDIISYSGN